MGTRGLFQVYDASTETYTYYYIHNDSLAVLKELRNKLRRCRSIKSIHKVIAGLIAKGIIHDGSNNEYQIIESGSKAYTSACCWPFLEYSLTLSLFPDGNPILDRCDVHWLIHPVYETMETGFVLAPHQRAAIFEGGAGRHPKNGSEVAEKSVTKPSVEKLAPKAKATNAKATNAKTKKSNIPKAPQLSAVTIARPRGRPPLTQEQKAERAASRALLKFQQAAKAMVCRFELSPWTWGGDGSELVC